MSHKHSPTINPYFDENNIIHQNIAEGVRIRRIFDRPGDTTTVLGPNIKEKYNISISLILAVLFLIGTGISSYLYFHEYKELDNSKDEKERNKKKYSFWGMIAGGVIGVILLLVHYYLKKEFKPSSKVIEWTR